MEPQSAVLTPVSTTSRADGSGPVAVEHRYLLLARLDYCVAQLTNKRPRIILVSIQHLITCRVGCIRLLAGNKSKSDAVASTCKMQHQKKKKHIDASLSGDDSFASDINPGPEPELSSGIKCSAGAV